MTFHLWDHSSLFVYGNFKVISCLSLNLPMRLWELKELSDQEEDGSLPSRGLHSTALLFALFAPQKFNPGWKNNNYNVTFGNVSHERLFWTPWLRRGFWRADKERCFGHSNNNSAIAFQTLPSSQTVSPRPMQPHHLVVRQGCDAIFWQQRHFSMIVKKTKAPRSDVWPAENTDVKYCSDVCIVSFLKDCGESL